MHAFLSSYLCVNHININCKFKVRHGWKIMEIPPHPHAQPVCCPTERNNQWVELQITSPSCGDVDTNVTRLHEDTDVCMCRVFSDA